MVTLTNTGSSVAFFVEVVAVDQGTGRRIVPIFWSDNYVTLLPGEQRTVKTVADHPLVGIKLLVQGWNLSSESPFLA